MVILTSYLLSALVWTALYPAAGTVSARQIDRKHIQALQRQAADRFNKNKLAASLVGGDVTGVKNFTFSNPTASGKLSLPLSHETFLIGCCIDCWGVAFYVDGTTIPEVDWDVGPSWAGLLPISGSEDETRKVSVLFIFIYRFDL